MGRRFSISGVSLTRVLYASQLVALLLAVIVMSFSLESITSYLLAFVFSLVVITGAVGLWRRKAKSDGKTYRTVDDITYDPFAHPGHMAKDRWEKAVRRLPGSDDERD